ncbi:MAG: hypothetical protein Kow00106_02400 [Anaerolineae bacterium]
MRGLFGAFPRRIALFYFVFSAVWIVGSDTAVTILTNKTYLVEQTVKGLAFITATTVLLYTLLKREKDALDRADKALQRVNRAYRLLSAGNQAIVRAEDETGLLDALCQTIVTVGGYRLAWVGFAEQTAERLIRPAAWAGHEADYLATIRLTWAEEQTGLGPAGRAIRTRQPQTSRFIADDPSFFWRAEALQRGYQSVVVLPFLVEGEETGILAIYAAEPDAFDGEEVCLLDELARDLAYGLRALRARRALQDATRALAEVAQHRLELDRAKLILSMAAHDLRNPLAVIQSATDLLYRYGDRLSEEEREKRRTRIAESIRFMKSLLDDILLMSKAESPAFSIHLESLDIKAFCHQVLADIAQTVSEYRLHFECPEQDVSAITDPKLLRHILTNLLENAVRYSPAGSTVTLSLERQSDRVILRVRDQGIGIPAADQARLFEPFFRASNAGNIRGNGLGLTIVRQAVEALGGSIAVESAEGQGSTFTVTLPLLSADE